MLTFLDFYGLKEEPFGVTPDPRFLYLSPEHREALASIYYGIEAGRGFLALIAVPGMGKTTLLFHLLERFRSSARTAFLFRTQCTSCEFMRSLLKELSCGSSSGEDPAAMDEEFNQLLLQEAQAGRRCVVIIDEAQNLDPSVLETIRLLSDFETPRAKLLQIVLAGQPELAEKLALPSLVQLRQRISLIARLGTLPPQETRKYLEYRLKVAGLSEQCIFTSEACGMIAELSRGIPRNINNLCFNALSFGCALGQKTIGVEILREVAADFDLTKLVYKSALQAYHGDEIETALSKQEHSFSVARANPNAAIPERDAVYQSFYQEVRSEPDSIHSSPEEVQLQFSEKNLTASVRQGLLAKAWSAQKSLGGSLKKINKLWLRRIRVRATELLHNALSLNARGPGLRDAVVNVLTEPALAEDNSSEAEPLYPEASELDATHPAVRALRSSITEAKWQTLIGQCLTECRALVAQGKAHEAADRIRVARAQYPNDPRLEQYEASLQKEVNAVRRKEEKGRDRIALGENRRLAEQNADPANLLAVLERSYLIRAKHPDDLEIVQSVAEVELAVKRAAKIEDLSQLLGLETALTGTDGRPVVSRPGPAKAPQSVDEEKGPNLVDKSAEKTKLFEPATPKPAPKESAFQILFRRTEDAAQQVVNQAVALVRPPGEWSPTSLLAASSVLVLAVGVAYMILRNPGPTKPPAEVTAPARFVQITTDPADSTITSGGNPVNNRQAAIGATIEVSHLGYKTRDVQIQSDTVGKITLVPETVHLSIYTSDPEATVKLDDQPIDLADSSYEIPPDGNPHTITVTQGKTTFALAVKATIGSQPQVTALDANDVFAITSLGNQATVYIGKQLKNFQIGDPNTPVDSWGTPLTLSSQNQELAFRIGDEQGSVAVGNSNAPALTVQSLNAQGQVVVRTNVENIEKATLTVGKAVVPRGHHGWTVNRPPGSYTFSLAAPGYETNSWSITMQRGKVLSKKLDLQPSHVDAKLSPLKITGGTPGATVVLDNKTQLGLLDPAGNLTVSNLLAVGKHTVAFAKPGYETKTYEVSVITPGSEGTIPSPVLSSANAILAFQVTTAKNVKVRYRRVGQSQVLEVNPVDKIELPLGEYEVAWDAPGYRPAIKTIELTKDGVTLPLNLEENPDFEIEDPSKVSRENGWLKAKTQGIFVNLKLGLLHEILIFEPPGKGLLRNKKKVEWRIDDPTHHAMMQYSLESPSGDITRKLVVGGKTSNQTKVKVDARSQSDNGVISVHVLVDGARVRITNDKGISLDDFTASGQDFSRGRIVIKTDAHFLVRSDNP